MSEAVRLIKPDWPAADGIEVASSTRVGGVSIGPYESLNVGAHVGDELRHVAENRRRLAAVSSLPGEPRWLQQVHGIDVVRDPQVGVEADAAYTNTNEVVLAVQTADCLPVVIVAGDGSELACAHAGWRGLAAGVLENTLKQFSAAPKSLLAWLGPAISQQAFEVGDEVREAFVAGDPEAESCFRANDAGRWQADLYGLARLRLRAAGIGRVYGGEFCTYTDAERFFSYRRDGQCGRMVTLVWRRA